MLSHWIGARYFSYWIVLFEAAGCASQDAAGQGAESLAANLQPSAAGAAAPNVRAPVPGRSARTVLHEEVNEAENLFFTEEGRLFVSGGEDIYEITRGSDGKFIKTDHFHEDCLVEGIALNGGYLYGVCTRSEDPELPAFLIAGELSANPVFRSIASLPAASVPNGMTFDPEGRLYITYFLTHQIARLTFAGPLEVARNEIWADGMLLANGLKYVDGAIYATQLDATLSGLFVRIPVRPDGKAGRLERLYWRPLAVIDDIIPFNGDFILTDFFNGTLIFWNERRGAYAETPLQTFYGPTSLAQGKAPQSNERQLIVAEKGQLMVRDEREGDLLSMYQLP